MHERRADMLERGGCVGLTVTVHLIAIAMTPSRSVRELSALSP
jgi:hypothetical protein